VRGLYRHNIFIIDFRKGGKMRRGMIPNLVVLLFLYSTAPGATRLVPSHYPTIQAAIDACADGDTVIVAPGTYYENIYFKGKNIVLTSTNPNDATIVDATLICAEGPVVKASGGSLLGFNIRARGDGVDCKAYSPVISHCHITATERAISVSRHHAGTTPVIVNNVLEASWTGIYLFSKAFAHGDVDAIIKNNVIIGDGSEYGVGIEYRAELSLAAVTGNIITNWDNGIGFTYSYLSERRKALIRYNNVWGNTHNYIIESAGPFDLTGIQGNISGDPNFFNPTDHDYHVTLGSPCIDAGDPNYVAEGNETDFEGSPRVIGGRVDIGPDEFTPKGPLVTLEIIGPQDVRRNFHAQYKAIAHYQDASMRNVTQLALWRVIPNSFTSIQSGLLLTHEVKTPRHTTIHLQYTEGDVTLQTETRVKISLPHTLYVPREYQAIRQAVDAAKQYDVVLLADGIYRGQGSRGINFRGKAIVVRSENGPNNCVIDCESLGRAFYFHTEEETDAVLDGLTIANGYSEGHGGAILCWDTSPTITNCIITQNYAASHGGAIACKANSCPTIMNCIITENTAEVGGGGISYSHGAVSIRNCTIMGNTASRGGGIAWRRGFERGIPTISDCVITQNTAHVGGGIHSRGKNIVRIIHCTISKNTAERYGGGGIYCGMQATSTITACTITGNQAEGGSHGGGGIFCHDSTARIIDCIISGNTAESSGGGIFCLKSTARIIDCNVSGNFAQTSGGAISCYWYTELVTRGSTIEDNSAQGDGGGIYCSKSTAMVTNSTISGNRSGDYGGGIHCEEGTAIVSDCIISGNSVRRAGGGVSCESSDATITRCTVTGNLARGMPGGGIGCWGSTGEITNCIVWANRRQYDQAIHLAPSSSVLVRYSDVEGGWSGQENVDFDPCFVQAGYWADANDPNIVAAPTDPNAVWIDGDYHFLPNSPCINAGDPNFVPEVNETDIDGQPRALGGRVDMGADEFVIEVPMNVTPRAFNPCSQGKWLKAHLVLPEEFALDDVDTDTPATLRSLGAQIESEHMNVFVNEDGAVEVEAAFDRAALCEAANNSASGFLTIGVEGSFTSGRPFYGADTIRIINHDFRRLADFVSHWLQTDCQPPDWCSGSDLNHDSVVNFVDLAIASSQ
jgi:predicted outer membrane repeat protein